MYIPFDSFVLRTPLLPTKYATEKLKDMLSVLSDPKIQEAFYIASPDFYNEFRKCINQEPEVFFKNERMISSVTRYIQRMATRCTPFGLFAGCSVGRLGEKSFINLSKSLLRTTRLDMMYLCNLSQYLSNEVEIKNKIKYFPNTSIYDVNSTYRYIEYQYVNDKRNHQVNSVIKDFVLKDLLVFCIAGKTIAEIRGHLMAYDFPEEEVDLYLNSLISSQLLVSELEPTVTGDDYLQKIITILSGLDLKNKHLINVLIHIKNNLDKLDCKVQNRISLYTDTKELIKEIGVSYNNKHIFQVDMNRHSNDATLSYKVVHKLQKAIEFLNKITPKNENINLLRFQEAFNRRYEDKEIPLLLALDPEIGIGYPINDTPSDSSELLNDFITYKDSNANMYPLSFLQKVLLKKANEALLRGSLEIELSDLDFPEVKSMDELSPTIHVMFQIVNKNDKNMIYIKSCGGSSGANMISRFSHIDKEINDLVQTIARKEEDLLPDAIVAEIAHLPDSHVGNILYRKHIRSYEITYLAHNDLPSSKQIPISDISISIKNGKLYLRSNCFGKVIIPRLTSAHNFTLSSIPVYRFLCDMQSPKSKLGLYVNWGVLEHLLNFLPRVIYGEVILSYAMWFVEKKEINSFLTVKNDSILIAEVLKWRIERKLPQYVVLSDGDNDLFIDFDNPISIKAFLAIVKLRDTFRLKEFLFSQKDGMVNDQGGNCYTNEFLLAFYRTDL